MSHLVSDNAVLGGFRIAHGKHGKGNPVVLIHGTPSSSLIWRNIVPALVDGGHQVHLYDLLGYGRSERPWNPAVDTSVTAQVPVLEALLDHWGLKQIDLVAHDIGGAVAQRFALSHPDQVRSLTLIDSVSFDSWPSARTRQQMAAGLEALIKAPDEDHRQDFRQWILSTVHDPARLAAESLERYLDYISGPLGQASFFQHQVRHYDPRHTAELSDRLHELGRLPVQIIWGEQDAWQSVDWAYRLQAAIPGARLQVLPDCGHFAMEDKPEEISALLIDFIARSRMVEGAA
ncbi:MAG: alpha/beta hydrolase [Pseudomonadota bacterium]